MHQLMLWSFESFFDGLEIDIGPYRVKEDEMIEFAKKFDPQPFHLDHALARESTIGELIASGWYILSVFMRMQCDAFLNNSTIIVSPGVDRVRWIEPVRADDVLSGKVVVTGTRLSKSKPNMGIVTCDAEIGNQFNMIVSTLSTKAMFKRASSH